MSEIADQIQRAFRISRRRDYTGSYSPAGGGENNDTYVCEMRDGEKVVLRFARYEGHSLEREADALRQLKLAEVPELLYFNKKKPLNGRSWILENYVEGHAIERPTVAQYKDLGRLLAKVHKVKRRGTIDIWQKFLSACQTFGDEEKLLHHPEKRLRDLLVQSRTYFASMQPRIAKITPSLTHGDATPSNMLVLHDKVRLIDWELANFTDPMAEFSTIYYDDMEYNKGKWRTHITEAERQALYTGYKAGGGVLNEERIALWMIFDKLGAAIFLYWRLKESARSATPQQLRQYHDDLHNLIQSLERTTKSL